MYPGSVFNWNDNSAITKYTADAAVADLPSLPLFFCLFSSNKGPEILGKYSGSEFYEVFGYPDANDFRKHGQPLLSAQRIIENGGEILAKRLVATDATLANVIICYKVHSTTEAVKDASGNPLYITSTGEQTTVADGNTPLTKNVANLLISTYSVPGADSIDEVKAYASTLLDTEGTEVDGVTTYTYPLIIVTDNGRGASSKRVKITADYRTSKNINFEFYTLVDVEGTTNYGSRRFSVIPATVYNGEYVSIDGISHQQFNIATVDGAIESYISKMEEILGISDFSTYDVLNGLTKAGKEVSGIVISEDSVDISYSAGIALENGTNGTFGDAPFGTEAWKEAAVCFLTEDGEISDKRIYDSSIYDLDTYKISFAVDANYPIEVKNKLTDLANYRKDFMYFRDLGLGLTTRSQIIDVAGQLVESTFAANYITTYNIIDKASYKQINVTMTYSMIPMIVNSFKTGLAKPLAGIINGYVITEYVPGSINYAPSITPSVNEKDILETYRLNYACFSTENDFVVETEYTSQELYSQLSYINNVLAIQEVARAIRTYCPRIRYTLMSGSDFTEYKEDIDTVVNNYVSNFAELSFEYTQDEVLAANKIFSGDLIFRFNNFVQTEIFNIYAEL